MQSWDLALDLERAPRELPLFRRIAHAIAQDIASGRLKPGERLPSSRSLAEQLQLNRNTVVAAFGELDRGGWIEGDGARGTRVRLALPSPAPSPPRSPAQGAGFDLPPDLPRASIAPRGPSMRLLLGGLPDLRLAPSRELARAYGRAMRGARGRRGLDYADPQGDERLRAALGGMLARMRGVHAPPERLCVVRGSQQALYLAARALLKPNDLVVIEDPGYPPAAQVLGFAGAEICPLPVDQEGLDTGALADLCARREVRAVLVTPHHQHPTSVTLSPRRRRELMEIAARRRLILIEDDYDFEFHYDGPPVLPLAADDPAGVVVYVGTLSKVLAPGLRLGYLAAHPAVINLLASYRSWVDQQGDHMVEAAVTELIEEGVLQRHTRRVQRVYQSRRDVLLRALQERFPSMSCSPPSGGMALWARFPGVDTADWAARARERGVVFQPGAALSFDRRPSEHARIGFAACNERELLDAAERLAASLPGGAL